MSIGMEPPKARKSDIRVYAVRCIARGNLAWDLCPILVVFDHMDCVSL